MRLLPLLILLTIGHATARSQSTSDRHSAAQHQEIDYPEARRGNAVDTRHGHAVADPYRWMEAMQSAETQRWVDAQEELLEHYLSDTPTRRALADRIETLQRVEIYSTPAKAGDRFVYTKAVSVTNRPVLYIQDGIGGRSRVLIDPEEEFGEDVRLAGFSMSPDGRYVAFTTSEGSSRWQRVGVLDLTEKKMLSDELDGLHALSGGVSWTADESGFFYTRFELPRGADRLTARVEAPRVFYHAVGTQQSEDALVYERPDRPAMLIQHAVSEDGAYLVVTSRDGSSPNTRIEYLELDPGDIARPFQSTKFEELVATPDAGYAYLGNDGDVFWLYTMFDAPRGRIVAVDPARPGRFEEIVPQQDETVAGGSLVGGNAVSVLGDRFVVMYLRDAQPLVRVFGLDGELHYEIDLPGVGSIWGGFRGRRHDTDVYYAFLSLTTARTIYRLDLTTGESTVFKQFQPSFDPSAFETKHVFVTSTDGTRVPMFVAHRMGMELDGSAPAFMYGYGAFGWIAFPYYQAHILAWLERGGVYALPAIRGGGEYGEEWHAAGVGRHRQNAIDDYLAAAEWLIGNGYTSADRLVANGGSASGALAASALMQRPDLFGAGIIDIPTLDLLRYHEFTAAGAWVEEFGSAHDPADFEALLAYSPYHNIEAGSCYPPILTMVGEHDETAVPMHGYKFAAALQHAQACENPVLLKVIRGAGHNYGTTSEQQARTWADALAFALKSMGIVF